MADFLAVCIVVFIIAFAVDIFDAIVGVILFVSSSLAEVIDILIDKLRGTGG